jgi:hypothetical protein
MSTSSLFRGAIGCSFFTSLRQQACKIRSHAREPLCPRNCDVSVHVASTGHEPLSFGQILRILCRRRVLRMESSGVMAVIIHLTAIALWATSGLMSPSPPWARSRQQSVHATLVLERCAVPDHRKFLTAALILQMTFIVPPPTHVQRTIT